MSDKIIILDRDGVINQDSDDYIKSVSEWVPIPKSIEAIARLSQSGYLIFVATNQSGISRGLFTEQTLKDMHDKMCSLVNAKGGEINGIFYCPHLPEDHCDCRKPKTGLLKQIESQHAVSLVNCFFVGDSKKDLECANSYGCKGILVRTGKGEDTLRSLTHDLQSTQVYSNLFEFVEELLTREG